MSSLLRRIIKQAESLLSQTNPLDCNNPLENLKPLISNLTLKDVNLDDAYQQLDRYQNGSTIGFMEIYQSPTFIVSVFILNGKNAKIPLHDHPFMHGLIKVLDGRIKIDSYSLASNHVYEALTRVPHAPSNAPTKSSILTVKEKTRIVCTNSDKSENLCSLHPNKGNYHEISNLSETKSAFFDILTPPYRSEEHCHYYLSVESSFRFPPTELAWLSPIPTPVDFFTSPLEFHPADSE